MKKKVIVFLFMAATAVSGVAISAPLESFIKEAQSKQQTGDIEQAVQIMRKALDEYPDNPTVMGYLGGYIGIQAGQASTAGNMNEAGNLTEESFELLDKALALDSTTIIALFYRGLMGVNVPEFFGKLDQGVTDLESLLAYHKKKPESVPNNILFPALDILASGYTKQGKQNEAYVTLQTLLDLAPGTPFAEQANRKLKNAMTSDNRQEKTMEFLAKTIPEIGALKIQIDNDPDNPELLYTVAMAISAEAEKGYDKRIYEDTTFRTNMVFEIVELLDRTVKLALDNMKYLLRRGMVSVVMPFFINRLDQGIADLTKVIESNASEAEKAEAHFWLGQAYYKKATSEWIKTVTDFSKTQAADMTFSWLQAPFSHLDTSNYTEPGVVIEFVLGLRDELAPQTAIWIEDEAGMYVKTIYVSGFSGNVKDKQVTLPKWAQSSKFSGVDGVTSASINLGRHVYVWDLTDTTGNKIKQGKYVVKVETSFWPSMQYQLASISIMTGGKDENRNKAEEGKYIPFLEAVYHP